MWLEMAHLTPIWVLPCVFQKGQGLQRHRVSSFSVGSLQQMGWKYWGKKKMLYQKNLLVFHFGMKRGFYSFGTETARDWSSPENIRDQWLWVAVAQRKKWAPHAHLSFKLRLSSTFKVTALFTNHLIYPGAVPGSISNFFPIRAIM